jgi:hypothetical protein
MSTLTNNNIRSTDVSCRFFSIGNQEILLNHLDFSIKEMASEGVDSICGAVRDDPYTVTNYFDVDFNGTQLDMTLLNEYIANIASRDSHTGENPASVSFQSTTKKGVTNTYVFTGITRKAFNMSASGRADPFKFTSGFKAKNFVGPV